MSVNTSAGTYVPGPVERVGRRLKMEYVGMASVHAVCFFLIFEGLATWGQRAVATLGILLLFLGLKKKTRDHLSCSLLLFAAAVVAAGPLADARWAVPYFLFGGCVCALEGYVEKAQEQIYALPVLLFAWGWIDPMWPLALLFAALYLTHPWAEKPGLRKRYAGVFGLTVVAALAGFAVGRWNALAADDPASAVSAALRDGWQLLAPSPLQLWLLAGLGVPALVCLVVYWRRLKMPHKLNLLLFAVLAPWDVRWTAMFGMAAVVLLAATLFRFSIDSDRLRPAFKHAEWHFFWWVLVLAVWSAIWA
jgi:hypothetical protein